MDITKLIELLPDTAKSDVIDFQNVTIKVNGTKKAAIRVLFDRILTDDEIVALKKHKKHILYDNFVAQYKYAPEIKKTYCYVY